MCEAKDFSHKRDRMRQNFVKTDSLRPRKPSLHTVLRFHETNDILRILVVQYFVSFCCDVLSVLLLVLSKDGCKILVSFEQISYLFVICIVGN